MSATPAQGTPAFASPEPEETRTPVKDDQHPMRPRHQQTRRVSLVLSEDLCMALDRLALDAKEDGVADASKAAFARVLLSRLVEDQALREEVLRELRRTASR